MALRFYNSFTNQKEDFIPIREGEVGMYVCGMTVYDSCHLGHARAMMAFDILVRYLQNQDYKVHFVRNITDVDDKIIERAIKNNESIGDLTQRTISSMHEDFLQLGLVLPTHGGGPDLLFPHHENEIAQSECSSGSKFANYWLHSGLLKINGEKMSKSLGNFAMLKDLFISYHPEVLRYYLISSHYRSSLNFDPESLNQAKSALTRLYQALASVEGEGGELDQSMVNQFSVVMNDDLNTPEALSLLFQLAKLINSSSDSIQKIKYGSTLKELSGILGLLEDDPKTFFQFGATLSDKEIDQQIALRNTARDAKDFQTADQIRDSLIEKGIILDDSSEGTTWKKS